MTTPLEELLVRVAARVRRGHRATVADRPVAPQASNESAGRRSRDRCPTDPTPPGSVLDDLLAATKGGHARDGRTALLRVRRSAAPCTAATAADIVDDRLGPAGLQRADVAPSRGLPNARPAAGSRISSGFRAGRLGGFRHRRPGRQQRRPGRGAASGPRADAGWDVERDGLVGAPQDPGGHRGGAARHGRPGAATARPRHGERRARGHRPPTGAIDVDALRAVLAGRRRHPDDRVPAGRQREHRRVGRLRPRHPGCARAGGLGARGRRFRALGRCQPADGPAGRRRRGCGLLGNRRATSGSTCPYDCGLAFCADPQAQAADDVLHRRLPGRLGRGPTTSSATWCRSRHGGPVASPVWAALARARPQRRGRPGRPVLRARRPDGRPASGRRGHDPQRRRAQPGARRLRRPHQDRRGHRGRPARRAPVGSAAPPGRASA